MNKSYELFGATRKADLALLPAESWASWDLPDPIKSRMQHSLSMEFFHPSSSSPMLSADSPRESSSSNSDGSANVFGTSRHSPSDYSGESLSPPRKRIAVDSPEGGDSPAPVAAPTNNLDGFTLTPNDISEAIKWAGSHESRKSKRAERMQSAPAEESRVPRREKARRQDMNEAIEQLRELVPHELGLKPTKSAVLWNSVDYIERLQTYCSSLVSENKALRRKLDQVGVDSSNIELPTLASEFQSPAHEGASRGAPHTFQPLHPPPPLRTNSNTTATALFSIFVVAITLSSWSYATPSAENAQSRLLLSADNFFQVTSSRILIPLLTTVFIFIFWLFDATCAFPASLGILPLSLTFVLVSADLTPKSAAYDQVVTLLQKSSSFYCSRKDIGAMSDRAAALLGRQKLSLPFLPASASLFIECCFQCMRFVCLQLFVGFWIERAVLRVRKIQSASLQLEMSFWLNRLESHDTYNLDQFTDIMKTMNHLILIHDDTSSPQTQVMHITLLKVLGSLIARSQGTIARWIGAQFTSRAQKYGSASADLEKCLIGLGNDTSPSAFHSKMQAFFAFLGGDFMFKSSISSIDAMNHLLKGRLTAAKAEIDKLCAQVPPSPISRIFIARMQLLPAGALWLSRKYAESANVYLQILSTVRREEDSETHIMSIISMTACFIKLGPKLLDVAEQMVSYLHTPVCTALIGGDPVRHLQVVGLRAHIACMKKDYIESLKLWESIQDDLERHSTNQLLNGTAAVGFDISLKCFKELRKQRDSNMSNYVARSLVLARRCLAMLRVQTKLGSLFSVLYWYADGRQQSQDPDEKGPSAQLNAVKSLSYCKELCAQVGPDVKTIAAKCDALISRITGSKSHTIVTSI
jgi:predicted small integral membrane protein